MSDKANPVTEIQDLWPSYEALAEDLGVTPIAVQVMRTRRTIHPDHFPTLIKAATRRKIKGVTYDRLFTLRPRKERA